MFEMGVKLARRFEPLTPEQEKALKENILSFMEKVIALRPSSAKGRYLNNMSVSSTMGPGIKIDRSEAATLH